MHCESSLNQPIAVRGPLGSKIPHPTWIRWFLFELSGEVYCFRAIDKPQLLSSTIPNLIKCWQLSDCKLSSQRIWNESRGLIKSTQQYLAAELPVEHDMFDPTN
jgi:hypothetical protein